ncbi:MAG: hypothetical protein AAB871_00015 [Patescibacteria group bacterium]
MAKSLTVSLGQQLKGELKSLAQLEGRHVSEQTLYLLGAIASLALRFPALKLEPGPTDPIEAKLAFAIELSGELEDRLFHLACSYGLSRQELIRTFLWMGVRFRKRLAGQIQDPLIRQEVFVELILESLQPVGWVN